MFFLYTSMGEINKWGFVCKKGYLCNVTLKPKTMNNVNQKTIKPENKLFIGQVITKSGASFTVLEVSNTHALCMQSINDKPVAYEVSVIRISKKLADFNTRTYSDYFQTIPSHHAFGTRNGDASFSLSSKDDALKYFKGVSQEQPAYNLYGHNL